MTEYTEVIAENAGPIVIISGPQGEQGIPGEDGAAGKSAFQSAVEGGYIGSEEKFYQDLAKIGEEKVDNVEVGLNYAEDLLDAIAEALNETRKSGVIFLAEKGEYENIKINSVGCYASGAGAVRFDVYEWDGNLDGGTLTFAETLGEVTMGAAGKVVLDLPEKYYTDLEKICVLAVSTQSIIGTLNMGAGLTFDKVFGFEDGDYYSNPGTITTVAPVSYIAGYKYDYDTVKNFTTEEAADSYFKRLHEADLKFADIEKEIEELKYVPIEIIKFTNSGKTLENGNVINPVAVSWELNKEAAEVTIDGVKQSTGKTGLQIFNEDFSTTTTWTLIAKDEKGVVSTKYTTLYFYDGVYYGAKAEPETLDSAFILGLSKQLSGSKNLTVNIEGGEGLYFYYAYPASMGKSKFNIGGFDYEYEYETVSFTNRYGLTKDYYVYKSGQPITESVSVTVKGG